MSFFIPEAMAADVGEASTYQPFVMLAVFGVIFYFLIWRPQSKRAKEHKGLIAGLGKGDEVVTNGGITGKITNVSDEFATVEVSEGVNIRFQKSAVVNILPKGTLKAS